MRGPRRLYVLAALCALFGVTLRAAPVRAPAPVAAAAPQAASPASRPVAAVEPGRLAAITAGNAFSATRVPPASRFVPEGLRRDTQPVARPKERKPAEFSPRLFGITQGPGGAVALIDADPNVPGAEVYRVGDEVRGGRVTRIGDSTVVLSRPSGTLVLRLPDAGDRR